MKRTIKQLLQQAAIDPTEAEILLAYVLAAPREFLIAHDDEVVGLFARMRFWFLVWRRERSLPIAQLTHQKEFFGFTFFVNKHVLVPRPDTEIMVEEVLDRLEDGDTLIDIGTGSSCIPIAIAKHTDKKLNKVIASDVSRKALRVAKKNAAAHEVDISFFHGSLLSPIPDDLLKHGRVILTANLPYLTEEQWEQEDSIKHEPRLALVAPEQGLKLYRLLAKQLAGIEGRAPVTAFFEIDPSQETRIASILKNSLPHAQISFKKDLSGLTRIATLDL